MFVRSMARLDDHRLTLHAHLLCLGRSVGLYRVFVQIKAIAIYAYNFSLGLPANRILRLGSIIISNWASRRTGPDRTGERVKE